MLQKKKKKTIGIRPGEKIHELLFSAIESEKIRFVKDHYVMLPNSEKKNKYINNKRQVGKKITKNFEYSSETNKDFLSIKQIRNINKEIF